MAYLSKELDTQSSGGSSLIERRKQKLTFPQPTTVYFSHSLADLLLHKATKPFHLLDYNSSICSLLNPHTLLWVKPRLNPASLSLVPTETTTHSSLEILDSILPPFLNMTDQPIPIACLTCYIDGSSFLYHGTQRAGYALTSLNHAIEANPLPLGTIFQKAELIALIWALTFAAHKTIKMCLSYYIFLCRHLERKGFSNHQRIPHH